MPNRIIKESIHGSEKISGLTDFQFRLWVNLITYVDDYGRGDARPAIIKGACFPLRDRVTVKDIDGALHALAGAGCVGLYEVDGRPYLYFPRWGEHQRIQTKRSKYPAPRESTVDHGGSPPESESESESESISESKSKSARARGRERTDGGFEAFAKDKPALLEALRGYKAMRESAGKPLVERSEQNLLEKLEIFPERDWVKIVDQATNHGWMEFYAIDRGREQKKGKTGDDRPASYDIDKAMREAMTTVPKIKKKEKRD